MTPREPATVEELRDGLRDARARTLELLVDLDDAQWLGPERDEVNPPLWELGHVAWFQERWCLRQGNERGSLRPWADAHYDSAAVAHGARWRLELPDRAGTLAYAADVLAEVERRLADGPLAPAAFELHLLALFHEDMHGEAFASTRQTLGYSRPTGACLGGSDAGPWPGDVEVPGGSGALGASAGRGFAFDNEHRRHAVALAPFRIARAAVTQAEFRDFVEQGGYRERRFWSAPGWAWRRAAGAEHPVYWRGSRTTGWERRHYDRWVALEPHLPVHFVNAHEAEAYCGWAGRRLPTEAEWEHAAGPGRFPWGDDPAEARHACLDLRSAEPCDVAAHPDGDSPFGLRQMLGNVWEWTASLFRPYPGFEPGAYREYSEPWFTDHRVLRGGAFATRARMIHSTYRNFYTPERRDVMAGFRTCAVAAGSRAHATPV